MRCTSCDSASDPGANCCDVCGASQTHCHAGLAELDIAAGAQNLARIEFNKAIDLYRTMGMTSWQAKTENSLALLG
jgi:hypothetical protein